MAALCAVFRLAIAHLQLGIELFVAELVAEGHRRGIPPLDLLFRLLHQQLHRG
jgi:hypothetical protein